MLDLTNRSIYSFQEFKSDAFKFCVPRATACVTSFSGYSGISTDDSKRNDINDIIEDFRALRINLSQMLTRLGAILFSSALHERQAKNVLQGVDVTFNKERSDHTRLHIPGGDGNVSTGDISFNTCVTNGVPNPEDNSRGDDFFAYATAVHEAGHALGFSNINQPVWQQSYSSAHPTIPDTVMN